MTVPPGGVDPLALVFFGLLIVAVTFLGAALEAAERAAVVANEKTGPSTVLKRG